MQEYNEQTLMSWLLISRKHDITGLYIDLLEHRPLKVGHPCLLPLQQTWKKSFQRPKCPLRWNDLAPTLKFQVRLRFVQENHLKSTNKNLQLTCSLFHKKVWVVLPRNWHPPWQDGKSLIGSRWRSQSWCFHRQPQIVSGRPPERQLSWDYPKRQLSFSIVFQHYLRHFDAIQKSKIPIIFHHGNG